VAAEVGGSVNRNIRLLYGFSFFNPFMIVIPVWVPYLATQGITMRQFMELQAIFAIVILCGEVPSGLLSDLWGKKKTLLGGSTLKAISFSLLPLWSSYEGFLFSPGPPGGLWDRRLGIAVRLVRARNPVLDRLRTLAPSADPAGHAPEPGRRAKRVTHA